MSPASDMPNQYFYEGGGRSKAVSQILHCIRSSPGIIVLTGPTGSGRSHVLDMLEKSFRAEEGDLCLLSEESMVLETEEELYRAMATGFGLEDKTMELLEDLVERVEHFIRVNLQNKRNVLIAVDDVRQHSPDLLAILLQLASSNKGLNLLLVGEDNLLGIVKQFHVQSLLVHHIALRPLLTEEVADFVRRYLAQKGVSDDSLLDRKKLDELMSKTGGNLSLLARELAQFVSSLDTGRQNKLQSFPFLHLIAIAIVITVTVLGVMYYPGDTQPRSPDEPIPLQLETPKPVEQPGLENNVPDDKSDQNEATPEYIQAVTDTAPVSGVSGEMDAGVKPSSQVMYTEQEEALLKLPATHYSLQLASLSSEKAVTALLSSQRPIDRAQMYFYRRGAQDKPAYIVLYGDYPDKAAAFVAEKLLPETLRKSAPWPRSLADIQHDLEMRQ